MTLRTRVLAASLLANVIVAAGVLTIVTDYQDLLEARLGEVEVSGASVLWKRVVEARLDLMTANTSALTRNRQALKALSDGDADALAEAAIGTTNRLKALGALSRLRLAGADGKIVYTAPYGEPGRALSSDLGKAAMRDGKVKSGIERDETGRLGIVLALPLLSRGKLIGCGIFQLDLDAALGDLKSDLGSEGFVLNSNGAVEFATDISLARGAQFSVPKLGETASNRIPFEDRTFSVSVAPIFDTYGTALAHLISARDDTEQYQEQRELQMLSYGIAPAVLLIASVCLFVYMKKSFEPLQKVLQAMGLVADHDLTVQAEVTRDDEVGKIAAAANEAVAAIGSAIHSIRSEGERLGEGAAALEKDSSLIATKASEVATKSITVSEDSSKMADNATAVKEAVKSSTASVQAVAAAIEETSANLRSIANESHRVSESVKSASEVIADMRSGTEDIAANAENASMVADRAIVAAASTDKTIGLLRSSADEISDVIGVISGIAAQTNLLALNAAIEAASAGAAGNGFAVVAEQVKRLAVQTTDATKEISEKIESMRRNADDSIAEIQGIGAIIDEMNESSNTIASSAGAQSAQSREVTDSVELIHSSVELIDTMIQQAAIGVDEVAENAERISSQGISIDERAVESAALASSVSESITTVTRLAHEAADESSEVKESSRSINEMVQSMRAAVDSFKV